MSGGGRVCAIYAKKLMERGCHVNVIAPQRRLLAIKKQLKRLIKGVGWLTITEQSQSYFDLLGDNIAYPEPKRPVTSCDASDADIVIATW